jgi:hypothetical protein
VVSGYCSILPLFRESWGTRTSMILKLSGKLGARQLFC